MTLRTTATNTDLDRLLDRLVDQVPGTRNALVLSDGGLVVCQSAGITRVAGVGVDDLGGVCRRTTTTVALDFGRIAVSAWLVLHLTPGRR